MNRRTFLTWMAKAGAAASLKDLATKYGVAVMTVQNIVTWKTWRHV